jgi:Mn2+/Fe2+ NRAMP family transporter
MLLAEVDLTGLAPVQLGIFVLGVTVIAATAAWFITRSMVRVAENVPDPQPLVIALALLTLLALLGALVTGNENAYTLSATGLGAIAGAVTATWKGGPVKDSVADATDAPTDSPLEDTDDSTGR